MVWIRGSKAKVSTIIDFTNGVKNDLESWDILDKYGNNTGKTIVKGKTCLLKGEYHLVVHIWIVNEIGQLLIQKRTDNKDMMPGKWAATGGSALSGESSVNAAIRELSEELGIYAGSTNLKLLKRFLRKNSIADLWCIKMNIGIESLILQEDEVAEVKWVTKDELQEMLNSGIFHNYGADYFNTIFSLCNGYKQLRGVNFE